MDSADHVDSQDLREVKETRVSRAHPETRAPAERRDNKEYWAPWGPRAWSAAPDNRASQARRERREKSVSMASLAPVVRPELMGPWAHLDPPDQRDPLAS